MKRIKCFFNKNTKKYYKALVIIFSFIFLFFNSIITAENPKKLKKLYVSTIKVKEGIPNNIADKVKKNIKLTIFEKYGTDYQVLDDDAIKVMYKQASAIMASGCDDTSCVTQIADGINADEIIYGYISKEGFKLNLYVTNLERKDLSLTTKSVINISFLESQLDHFCGEAAKKLMNKNYKINMKATIDYDPESLDVSVMKFTSNDESISMILDYLKELVREGDNAYTNKEYINAINSYNKVFEKMNSKLTEEKRKKLIDFSDGIIKRYIGIYEMFGDSAYKDYKFEDAIRNYKEALSKTRRLSSSVIIAILEKRIVGKITLSEKTGEIYLFNTSKSLLDQAEYYNIRDDNGNALRILSKARETIEKSNFSNIEITTAYNDLAKILKKDLIFTERTFGTIKCVYISGGNFNMDFDNVPSAFVVKENGFWLGKYEMTQKEYMEVMGSNPSFFRGNDLPVENVSWNDCMEFCKIFGSVSNTRP